MGSYPKLDIGVEWINSFPPSGQSCHQDNLSYRDDCALGFYYKMKNKGHIGKFKWGNINAWEKDFRDQNRFQGIDHLYVDNVHFCYFTSHGGNSDNTFYGAMASQKDFCSWSSAKARFGDGKLRWIVIDTCHSLDLGNIKNTWDQSFKGLHMIFGFKGTVSDSRWMNDRGEDFASEAGTNHRLTNAWLDAAYSWWMDDYPVVLVAGLNKLLAKIRLNYETISHLYYDIPQIGYYIWKWRD